MEDELQRYALDVESPKEMSRPLQLPERTLLGPGPSNCSKRVLRSLGCQLIGHLQPEMCQLMDEIKAGLQYAFQTRNALTLALSASGHGGMEACIVNLIEPGETVLIAKCGFWGERAADMVKRIGANVEFLETECGTPFNLEQLELALRNSTPVAVFVVHAESSSGMKQPLKGVGELVHRFNALLIVDAVASLGGEPLFTDTWGIDAVYTGSQKVLGAPPGITPISFSPSAEAKLFRRKSKVPVYYFDLTIIGDYWNCFGNRRVYHHTISATLVYGLREALSQLAEEGLLESWSRHAKTALKFREGLRRLNLEPYIKSLSHQSSTVVAIKLPVEIDAQLLSTYIRDKRNVEISGGLGPTNGKVLRVGLMGVNSTPKYADIALGVLEDALREAVKSKI